MSTAFLKETFTPQIDHVSSVAVNAGGTGYSVNDIITMNLGTGGVGTACTLRVLTLSGSAVATVSVESSGVYTTKPIPTTAITQASVVPGGGTGFTGDLTFTTERMDNMIVKALADVMTGGQVLTVAVDAGGTGYTTGDEVTLNASGDVVIFDARFEVTSETAGVVDGIRMVSSGAFTTLPNMNSASHATTGGTGSGLTVDLTVRGPYSAVPGGTQTGTYIVGDVLTVAEGTLHAGSVHHQFVVTTVLAGDVTAVEPLRIGRYDTQPTNPVTVTGGSGSGVTLTFTKTGWTMEGANAENLSDGLDLGQFFMAVGSNLSGGDPMIGCMSLNVTGGEPQIGLLCATGYDDSKNFITQPGASNTAEFSASAANAAGGPRICSAISGTFTLYVSLTGRRVVWVQDTTTSFQLAYQGMFTPFIDSPSTKWPFPLCVGGTAQRGDVNLDDPYKAGGNATDYHCSLLRLPENRSGSYNHAIRDVLGAWKQFSIEGGNEGGNIRVWPMGGFPDEVTNAPNIETGTGTVPVPISTGEEVLRDGTAGSTNGIMKATIDPAFAPSPFGEAGDNLYFLIAPILYRDEPSAVEILGELEGLFYMNGRGLSAKDRIKDANGLAFTVFAEVSSGNKERFYALKEAD